MKTKTIFDQLEKLGIPKGDIDDRSEGEKIQFVFQPKHMGSREFVRRYQDHFHLNLWNDYYGSVFMENSKVGGGLAPSYFYGVHGGNKR